MINNKSKYKRQNCQKLSKMVNFGTYWVIKKLSYCKIKKITSKALAPHHNINLKQLPQ